mgnify:CR=1 FL=1
MIHDTRSSSPPPQSVVANDCAIDNHIMPTSPPISATVMTTPKLSPPCSDRIRAGLLNKLGIVDQRSPPPMALPPLPVGVISSASDSTGVNRGHSILGPVKVIKAPLKGSSEPANSNGDSGLLGTLSSFIFKAGTSPTSSSSDEDTARTSITSASSSSSAPSSPSQSQQQRPSLTFHEEVSVIHIPTRKDYSSRMQQHLWHSRETLRQAVLRNTVEYAADGWDWQAVCEEEHHYKCPNSGELIHPVHEEIAKLIRKEQGLPDDAPISTPYLP